MEQKELSNDERLRLITQMIGEAKRNIAKGGSYYFLLWGWVVLIANTGHYFLEKFELYEHPYIVWLITIPAVILTIMRGARSERNAQVRSHLDRLYGKIWMSVGVGIVITLVFMPVINFNNNAIILILAGMGTFISGHALRFTPLIMGAVALWIASIVSFNLSPMDQQLAGAVGIFAGYLIPAYLLKKAENESV